MRCVPLGDQAVLVYCDDEAAAVSLAAAVRTAAPIWLQDVVPAYASVGVFFDANAIRAADVIAYLASGPRERAVLREGQEQPADAGRSPVLIPVCYELGPDLPRVAERTRLSPEDVIRLHLGTGYTVYAIGFVPGFPYLGYLPSELCGVPRLESPRIRVEPGSVGLTGRQTGIYPLARPGGWNLIGRTPLTIVDVADGFFPLRVGDRVRFTRIDDRRYRELQGERLVSNRAY
jgi:inhibitor of KinA